MPSKIHISPLTEALSFWVLAFLLLLGASFAFGQGSLTKLIATLSFLLLPKAAALFFSARCPSQNREIDFGLHFTNFKAELRLFFWLFLPILLFFPLLYASWLYASHLFSSSFEWQFQLRFPPRFFEWVVDYYFVVALSEEFFYRGYLQSRLNEFWPKQATLLKPSVWLTAALFALGHLATFNVARLSVFFPALLFGWAKEKTQGLLCPVLLHGSCNLLLMVLQESFVQTTP